jgi:hypothetical protein
LVLGGWINAKLHDLADLGHDVDDLGHDIDRTQQG